MSNATIAEFAKFIIELADDMKKSAESILQENKHPMIGSGERLLKNIRIITANTHYAGVAASRLREGFQHVAPTYVYPEPHPIPPGFRRIPIPMGGGAGGGGGTGVTIMTMGTPNSWNAPEPAASDKAPVTEFVEPEYGLTNWAMNDYK